MIVLYPVVASVLVVVAQYAYTQAEIAAIRKEEKEQKVWKGFRNFCYFWAVILIVAALFGHFWYRLPISF